MTVWRFGPPVRGRAPAGLIAEFGGFSTPRRPGASGAQASILAFTLLGSTAHAAPQLNVGIAPGIDWRPDSKVAFDGSVSADVLFGRTGDATFGIGPRLEVGTRAFDDLRLAAGLTAQLPSDPIAVLGTVNGLIQTNQGSVDPGIGARCFVGLRPYNHYGFYSAALGLSVGVDHVFGADTTSLLAAVHVDGMWLSLPFLFLFNTVAY